MSVETVEKVAREWPPLKKALWDVVTGEELNTKYVNAWDLTDKLYEAALAAIGERGAASHPLNTSAVASHEDENVRDKPAANDPLAPVREDVIRMRLEALFADKPADQWGPMGLAEALSPNVEFLVAAAVSNERMRFASPPSEASRDEKEWPAYAMTVEPQEDGTWLATCPELPGCIATADTPDAAFGRLRDVQEGWLSICHERGIKVPEPATAIRARGEAP